MKKIISIILIVVIFTILYIGTFHLKIREIMPVYTYYGIFTLIILTVLLALFLFVLNKMNYKYFDIKDSIIIILLCFSINIFVFCMVPVTIERAISVFMLNYMDNNNEYTKEEIEKVFIEKYVYEYQAFEKRFEEQIYTGTIENNGESYHISKKGKFLVDCFHFIKELYNVKGKVLNWNK